MSNNNNSNNNSSSHSNPQNNPVNNNNNNNLLSPSSALELFRLSQLQQYANLSRLPQQQQPQGGPLPPNFLRPPGPGPLPQDFSALLSYHHPSHPIYNFHRFDPRFASLGLCRAPDEPKPQHSYIGLIAMAILSHPDKKLVLSDIYQYILDNYPYFRSRGPGWRNSIRHNLSLNECFIKAGRSANGKGHYWAIHPANLDDFIKGDFRRRKAQRKFRKHMGLAVDDEDSPSPPNSPPPINWPDPTHPHHHHVHPIPLPHPHAHPLFSPQHFGNSNSSPNHPPQGIGNFHYGLSPMFNIQHSAEFFKNSANAVAAAAAISTLCNNTKINRRQFDVASLLAPEGQNQNQPDSTNTNNKNHSNPPSPIETLKRKHHCGESSENSKNNSNSNNKKHVKYAISISSSSSSSNSDNEDISEQNPPIINSSNNHSPKTRSNSVSPIESIINQKSPQSSPISVSSILLNQQNSHYNHHAPHPHHQLIFPQYPNFSLHPNNLPNLFQNPTSLASLMFLSSRYRELTSGAQNNNNNLNNNSNNNNNNNTNSSNSPTEPIVNCMNLKRTA